MRKPFFKAVVAGMASVAMIAGMSACGRSANNADSVPMRSRPSIQARPPAT